LISMMFTRKTMLMAILVLLGCLGAWATTTPDLEFLADLVAVRSFSRDVPAVNKAQRLMKAWLEKRGVACTLEVLPSGNEVLFAATLPGKVQDFVLAPHLDTVPAEDALYPMRREGDKLFGRGVHDCKGNALAVAHVLVALNGKASVGCIFGADEEIGGATTRAMVERGYRPRKMVLVVDGGWNKIVYAQKGHTYFTVTARGRGGHSSRPWQSDDQVSRLMLAYAKLRAAWDAKFPLPPDKWTDVLSATWVKGDGGAFNRIPDEASFVVNLRSVRPESADEAEAFIREVTGLEVVRGEDCKPCSSDPNHPLVKALQSAMRRAYPGEEITLGRMPAATDARCFHDCGVPVMVVGAQGGNAHASDEWKSVSGIGKTADWMIDFIRDHSSP